MNVLWTPEGQAILGIAEGNQGEGAGRAAHYRSNLETRRDCRAKVMQ